MSKFRPGQRVRILSTINKNMPEAAEMVGTIGTVREDNMFYGYLVRNEANTFQWWFSVDELEEVHTL